jgi:predicted HTH transcriptional regulator
MANFPGGGLIMVGVAQDKDQWRIGGVSASELVTYDPDVVLDQINAFASPSIRMALVRHATPDGADLLVLEVYPFSTSPIVCKKNGPDGIGLTAGLVYIRPSGGKPESRPIRSAEEMHDLLDRAAEFRSRRFAEQVQRLGIVPASPPGPTDRQKFDEELGDL